MIKQNTCHNPLSFGGDIDGAVTQILIIGDLDPGQAGQLYLSYASRSSENSPFHVQLVFFIP